MVYAIICCSRYHMGHPSHRRILSWQLLPRSLLDGSYTLRELTLVGIRKMRLERIMACR